MRTVPFRDVLWGVANKMGLDPQQSNFLENQAIPIGDSIDQWVRRTYDARDWPEWVVTHKFQPVNHIVAWDHAALDLIVPEPTTGPPIVKLKRVLKVFLVDPGTTDAPVDTPFTLLDNGIHVGFEHGTYVWVRYMMPAPRFTAVQWSVATTYAQDDVAYSYTTGQVYRSKVSNNIGNDPAASFSSPPAPDIEAPQVAAPPIEITTLFSPPGASTGSVPQVTRISVTPGTTYPGSVYSLTIIDMTGVSHVVEYASATTDGAPAILTGLNAAIDASTDTYLVTVTQVLNTAASTLDLTTVDHASVDVIVTLAGSPWWELVPFPRELADQVMRGGYADLLKEWGQTDKGTAEEGNVPNEAGLTAATFTTMPDPPLTGQQRGVSRYKMEP